MRISRKRKEPDNKDNKQLIDTDPEMTEMLELEDKKFELEVFQITLHLIVPVTMLWIANQTEWFDDYMIQNKKELWTLEKEDQYQDPKEFRERIQKIQEEKLLQVAGRAS
ncbi:PREDICTED: protein PET100 homolog, mitochondrial-like [Odobenus rosmarus divergens]|uniref:Protein PET100 homolog, mitochondrial-like n=1 Tax=Odobenus rosmarus divergens TaxID=9708 RepID=A0A9B0GVD5_ODORO